MISLSPFKTSQKSQKKGEEKKTEPTLPELSLVPAMRNSDKVKGELFETFFLNPGAALNSNNLKSEMLMLLVWKVSSLRIYETISPS